MQFESASSGFDTSECKRVHLSDLSFLDSRSSHTRELEIGIPVATLPGAWRYRVSAGTGWPVVHIL